LFYHVGKNHVGKLNTDYFVVL